MLEVTARTILPVTNVGNVTTSPGYTETISDISLASETLLPLARVGGYLWITLIVTASTLPLKSSINLNKKWITRRTRSVDDTTDKAKFADILLRSVKPMNEAPVDGPRLLSPLRCH